MREGRGEGGRMRGKKGDSRFITILKCSHKGTQTMKGGREGVVE